MAFPTPYNSSTTLQILLNFSAIPENSVRREHVQERSRSFGKHLPHSITYKGYMYHKGSVLTGMRNWWYMHLMIYNPCSDKAKVAKPPLARWLSHTAVRLRVRDQKTIPTAPARTLMLWKELVYFKLIESQWEAAEFTGRALRSLKKCKGIFVYWPSLIFPHGKLWNKRAL